MISAPFPSQAKQRNLVLHERMNRRFPMVKVGNAISVNCPNCRGKILELHSKYSILRARVVFFRAEGTTVKCKRCGREVPVPVTLAT